MEYSTSLSYYQKKLSLVLGLVILNSNTSDNRDYVDCHYTMDIARNFRDSFLNLPQQSYHIHNQI